MSNDTVVIDGDLLIVTQSDGDPDLDIQQDGEAGEVVKVVDYDHPIYDGPKEITPSRETQVLETQEKILITNIVVNPIPKNYGLITWNGSVLTVS